MVTECNGINNGNICTHKNTLNPAESRKSIITFTKRYDFPVTEIGKFFLLGVGLLGLPAVVVGVVYEEIVITFLTSFASGVLMQC